MLTSWPRCSPHQLNYSTFPEHPCVYHSRGLITYLAQSPNEHPYCALLSRTYHSSVSIHPLPCPLPPSSRVPPNLQVLLLLLPHDLQLLHHLHLSMALRLLGLPSQPLPVLLSESVQGSSGVPHLSQLVLETLVVHCRGGGGGGLIAAVIDRV